MVEESKANKFSVKKLTIGRGVSKEDDGEWVKDYYEIQVEVYDEDSIHPAEKYASSRAEEYLRKYEQLAGDMDPTSDVITESLDLEMIVWEAAQGKSGPFERS